MSDYILREEVLDHGFVELIDVMPLSESECKVCDGSGWAFPSDRSIAAIKCSFCGGGGYFPRDLAIVNAARVSYLGESKGVASDKKLLKYLYVNKHSTPFEQVEFKFRIKAPVIYWWHQVRHRTWSYNLQSGRYTEYEDEFYVPNEWRLQSKDNKQGSTSESITTIKMEIDSEPYPPIYEEWNISDHFRDVCQWNLDFYKQLIKNGVAKEQARLFLPAFALYHIGYAKVDAKNLLDFLRLRTHEHAQWETRQYALAMERIFKEILPWTYEVFSESH